MEGPHLPYEGKAGWCDHVARKRFSLETMGGKGTSFKVQETIIKPRSLCAATISSVLAAEKVAPLNNVKAVKKVTVKVYKKAKDYVGTGEHCWDPGSRETADHSIPYVVAATLMDGTATPRSLDDAHLWNPELRASKTPSISWIRSLKDSTTTSQSKEMKSWSSVEWLSPIVRLFSANTCIGNDFTQRGPFGFYGRREMRRRTGLDLQAGAQESAFRVRREIFL